MITIIGLMMGFYMLVRYMEILEKVQSLTNRLALGFVIVVHSLLILALTLKDISIGM